MTTPAAPPVYLTTLHAGMRLRQGPILLESHRGTKVVLRIPKTNTIGSGATEAEALADLANQVKWWFLREGPRLTAPEFRHTKATRRMLAEWRVLEALIACDLPVV